MEQQKTKRTLKYEFTPEEMLGLGQDLSAKNQELRQLEEQKKSVVAEFGSRIAIAKEHISSLSDKVASGYEMRDTNVLIDYHLPERDKKTLTRTDTGESWVEPMNDTDHNLFNTWEQRERESAQDDEGELSDRPNVEPEAAPGDEFEFPETAANPEGETAPAEDDPRTEEEPKAKPGKTTGKRKSA